MMTQPKLTNSVKSWLKQTTTTLKLCFAVFLRAIIVSCAVSARAEEAPPSFPSFRHVDIGALAKPQPLETPFVLLTDEDFAPWSFRGGDGKLRGISVDLAIAACAEAKLACEIKAVPFKDMMSTLRDGKAAGVVSGLRIDAKLAQEFSVTRPYFQSMARFIVRSGSPLATPDIRTLGGKRVGYVSKTTHGKFLQSYFPRSALTAYDTSDEMLQALRTGQVDAGFGDAVQLSFWLAGTSARGCCVFLGKAFLHRDTFSKSLTFTIRRDKADLRAALDVALDQLETRQETGRIFARYLPSPIW
jgi:polar amino acid transport system substrate-binding protein